MIPVDPRAKALIFDIDGTLADTMTTHLIMFRRVMAKYNVNLPENFLDSVAGEPAHKTFARLIREHKIEGTTAFELANEKEANYQETIAEATPIKPVLKILIDHLGKLPIGCGTGGGRSNSLQTLNALGITEMFNAIVTASDVEHGKPAPDTYLKCAELLGIQPKDCLVFEDGIAGIKAAQAAGMMVVDVTKYL